MTRAGLIRPRGESAEHATDEMTRRGAVGTGVRLDGAARRAVARELAGDRRRTPNDVVAELAERAGGAVRRARRAG